MELPKSPAYDVYFSDYLNVFLHMLFVLLGGVLAALAEGYANGTVFDWKSFGIVGMAALATGIQITIKRYVTDNR